MIIVWAFQSNLFGWASRFKRSDTRESRLLTPHFNLDCDFEYTRCVGYFGTAISRSHFSLFVCKLIFRQKSKAYDLYNKKFKPPSQFTTHESCQCIFICIYTFIVYFYCCFTLSNWSLRYFCSEIRKINDG